MIKNFLLFILFITTSQVQANTGPKLAGVLDQTIMTYRYTGGRAYTLKFEDGSISYQYLSGSKPQLWWGPFPYKTMKTNKGEYLVAWYEQGYGDYITLLFDRKTKILYGSGLLLGKGTHFEKAEIITIVPF